MNVSELFRSDEIRVSEFICSQRRSRAATVEKTDHHELVFVRRGAFLLRTGGHETVMTPNRAMILRAQSAFAIEHPVDGGDECVILAVNDELFHDALRTPAQSLTFQATSSSYLAQHRLIRAASLRQDLETEERAFALIENVAREVTFSRESVGPCSARELRAVRTVIELLSARFTEALPLRVLANEAALSPWQLSRSFRRATGQTLHRFQNALRLRSALGRVLAGEDDLTTLALEHGFYDHSHFTGAFHREFGTAPSHARGGFKHSRPTTHSNGA